MSSISITTLCILAYTTTRAAGIMLPTPTRTLSPDPSIASPTTATITAQAGWRDWLRSPQTEEQIPGNTCGFSLQTPRYCVDPSAVCTNTLFSDRHAYEHCSTVGLSSQTFDTAIFDHSSWSYQSFPAHGQYYETDLPHGVTVLFTREGLTATGFYCGFYNESSVQTYLAASDMLDPAQYPTVVQARGPANV